MISGTVSVRESWQDVFLDWDKRIIKIAYLGNSVTVQKNGYRPKVHDLIREFTGNDHLMINAGIGGVGSVACSFFCDDLVIRHQPQICFVETSLADLGGVNPFALIESSLRGIVQKLRAVNCKVCFLHLYRADVMGSEEIRRIRSMYELIEDEFCVNSIHLNLLPEHGPENLLIDEVHTHEDGAEIYAGQIFSCLTSFKEVRPEQKQDHPAAARLSFRHTAILRDYIGERKHQYPVKLFKMSVPFLEIPADDTYEIRLPDVYCVGLLLIADEYCGKLIVRKDNLNREFTIHDQWCYQPRIQSVFWDETAGPAETLQLRAEGAENLKFIGLLCYRDTPFNNSHTLFINHG